MRNFQHTKSDCNFESIEGIPGIRIPCAVWERLLPYQKTGVIWMLNHHCKGTGGGILADDMGLGKTVQAVAFVTALQTSLLLHHSVLIVAPATLLRQWFSEFRRWWPHLNVQIIHPSGSNINCSSEDFSEIHNLELKNTDFNDDFDSNKSVSLDEASSPDVLITTYEQLSNRMGHKLLKASYSSIILDEGHRIRNFESQASQKVRNLVATSRFILSGTPIQNNLNELWSLMDFVAPGVLGTASAFKNCFAIPISAGGYINASSIQVHTAYNCAVALKDIVTPHLLRRIKSQVGSLLPSKQEHVLFCTLTRTQRCMYDEYLQSRDVRKILSGDLNVLAGIDVLRKICNHPDLLLLDRPQFENLCGILEENEEKLEAHQRHMAKSGKICVLEKILKQWWYDEGTQSTGKQHKVLLFCQTRQMLDIIQSFLRSHPDPLFSRFCRMDGETPISSRKALVDNFNSDGSDFLLFLLTTRVGGLGINLTGADRVIIYDPDWNPSTDMQARERAWRLGQTRPVLVYRLLMVGTIEEKIYQRQIFKHLLTNRILEDPKQSARLFRSTDLYDLFSPPPIQLDTNEPFENHVLPDSTASLINSESSDAHPLLEATKFESKDTNTQVDDYERIDSCEKGFFGDILKVSELHSTFEREKSVKRSDSLIIEREAKRRAEEAVSSLRKSVASSSNHQYNKKINKLNIIGGATSAQIISSLRRSESNNALDELVRRLILVFRQKNLKDGFTRYVASSEKIANSFKDITDEDDKLAFRHVLKLLASRPKSEGGLWVLRSEYESVIHLDET